MEGDLKKIKKIKMEDDLKKNKKKNKKDLNINGRRTNQPKLPNWL